MKILTLGDGKTIITTASTGETGGVTFSENVRGPLKIGIIAEETGPDLYPFLSIMSTSSESLQALIDALYIAKIRLMRKGL